eukprot:CAMPEP_0115842000 /NCGR_PEP_ID=MMETSP0287-20121206/7576_1 /TAXON_ID=412157 /ORGANISM="Chrysochromulina rotalis, Strain UIO044" /LENGTH=237 /DNA_ID=CAMNT_0003295659 /DNA_START=346 /DNA_END=1056 /DNA_ORIENTATION=-
MASAKAHAALTHVGFASGKRAVQPTIESYPHAMGHLLDCMRRLREEGHQLPCNWLVLHHNSAGHALGCVLLIVGSQQRALSYARAATNLQGAACKVDSRGRDIDENRYLHNLVRNPRVGGNLTLAVPGDMLCHASSESATPMQGEALTRRNVGRICERCGGSISPDEDVLNDAHEYRGQLLAAYYLSGALPPIKELLVAREVGEIFREGHDAVLVVKMLPEEAQLRARQKVGYSMNV